jgi:hypothetical protein
LGSESADAFFVAADSTNIDAIFPGRGMDAQENMACAVGDTRHTTPTHANAVARIAAIKKFRFIGMLFDQRRAVIAPGQTASGLVARVN